MSTEVSVLEQVSLDRCVSAAEVMRTIADKVPLPDLSTLPEPASHRWKIEFDVIWKGKLVRAAQEAEAAAQLEALLWNAEGDSPRWWDWGGRTRLPKLGEQARADGQRILESFTAYWERLLQSVVSGTRPTSLPPKEDRAGDGARLEQIGFLREDISTMLNRLGVPHSLGQSETDSNPPTTSVISSETEAADARIGRDSDPASLQIRRAVREARLSCPSLANAAHHDARLVETAWQIFWGWALDAQMRRSTSGEIVYDEQYPIIGFLGKAVIFAPGETKEELTRSSFAKRIKRSG